jgi:cellulose synthase/poly-beta-1,6-N-acetylglucosamine synthase-like glycosyltransferase
MDTTTTIQKQKQVDRSGLHKINPETDTPYISIIVPAYNEAQNLDILIREIKQVMAEHRYGYEIISVNRRIPSIRRFSSIPNYIFRMTSW